MRRAVIAVLVLALCGAAWADEFTDCLARAQKYYEAGDFLAAEKEMVRAMAIVQPKAKAQIPPPTIKGSTYTNYELGFRVAAVGADWQVQAMASNQGPDATYPLVSMRYTGPDQGTLVLFFMRNLRESLGSRFESIAGHEMEVMRAIGGRPEGFLKNLTDCSTAKLTEVKVAGVQGLRSEFTAKRDGADTRVAVYLAMTGDKLCTGIFIAGAADWPQRVKDFDNIVGTISFDVPIPAPAAQPPKP